MNLFNKKYIIIFSGVVQEMPLFSYNIGIIAKRIRLRKLILTDSLWKYWFYSQTFGKFKIIIGCIICNVIVALDSIIEGNRLLPNDTICN